MTEQNRSKRKFRAWAGFSAALFGAGWALACSASDSDSPEVSGSADGDPSGDGDVNVGSGTGGSNSVDDVGFGGADGGTPDLPPLPEEVEDDASYRTPVATGHYLWSANPESGRVALIDVVQLTTQVLPAGLFPTYLASIGTDDEPAAVVLNVGSSDATRFRVRKGEDDSKAEVRRDNVAVHSGANRWSRSQSGAWAVAWSAAESGQSLDPTEGFQDITVLALGEDEMIASRLTVGRRPSQVLISTDDERIIVVEEEGISVIDPSGGKKAYWINLGFDAERRDVSVNQAGTHALVRRTGEAVVELIDLLEPDERTFLTFPGEVTDLDLAKSGRGIAVIRERSEIATFTLEGVIEDPTDFDVLNIPGQVFGSAVLTEDGNTAILYTNALLNEKVNIVDLREDSYLETRTLDTQAPVYSVVSSPDGNHAVILAADDDLMLGDQGVPADAFSVVALREERFPRVKGTGARVKDVALGNSIGLVTATSESEGVNEAHLIQLPSLSVRTEELATRPLAAGVFADLDSAYVAQFHPEGRVTFFDFETDHTRTLTGFELAAGVVDE